MGIIDLEIDVPEVLFHSIMLSNFVSFGFLNAFCSHLGFTGVHLVA